MSSLIVLYQAPWPLPDSCDNTLLYPAVISCRVPNEVYGLPAKTQGKQAEHFILDIKVTYRQFGIIMVTQDI
jgi:hypothetical protein